MSWALESYTIDPQRIAAEHEGGHLLRSRIAAADGTVVGLH